MTTQKREQLIDRVAKKYGYRRWEIEFAVDDLFGVPRRQPTVEELERERDKIAEELEVIGAWHRHLSEKHPSSLNAVEFLVSRNLNRRCDSDGFIACERCQTMGLCDDYQKVKSRAASAEAERDEARKQLAWADSELSAIRHGRPMSDRNEVDAWISTTRKILAKREVRREG